MHRWFVMLSCRSSMVALPCLFLCIAFFVVLPVHAEIIEESGSLKEFFLGSENGCAYDNFLSHNVEGIARPGYNAYNPLDPQNAGFGSYTPIPSGAPGDELLANWKLLFTMMMRRQYEQAETHRQATLSAYPYEIVHLTGPEESEEYYLVREQLDLSFVDANNIENPDDDEIGSFNYGWGLYVFSVEPNHTRVCVQVVHPNDDYIAPYVAFDMFRTVGAGYYFFSSVGREVYWTQEGQYDNTKSLCDPSRVSRTVFQMAYEAYVDFYVDEADSQPFMVQMHSYDTGTRNFSSAIVSPGRYDGNFGLPLYDWSGVIGGMIDRTPWIVHPAGVIGNPSPIPLTSFYGSSSARQLEVYDDDGAVHLIPNPHDLYGHPDNQQINYRNDLVDACSDDEWTMHIELDELPNSIDDDTSEYNFYFADGFPVTWRNFQNITEYYHPMSVHLLASLEEMRAVRNDHVPTTPTEFRVTAVRDNDVDLSWVRSGDPAFYTYRIYWDLNPDVGYESPYVDRTAPGAGGLCAQTTESVTIDPGLLYDRTQYLAISGVSRSGRESPLSEVITVHTENTDPDWIWVVSPDGGEILFVDSAETIAWNPGVIGGNVLVELSRYGMDGPWETLTESTPNDSIFEYLVTGPPSQTCRIAVSSVEAPSQNDTSDADFSILIARTILSSSFESGSFDWMHSSPIDWNDNWHRSTERARSGAYAYKCGSAGTGTYSNSCDSRLTHIVIPDLPENARLRFYYQIQVELAGNPFYCYDGGVVEISVNGALFTQIEPVGGYPNEFVSPSTGPMPGRPCYAAPVSEWTRADFILDEYAGQNIQIQWRFGSDASVAQEGWYIDDVHIYEALYNTPGPGTVTAYRSEQDSLILRWDSDGFVSYRIFSSDWPEGPFLTYEGTTTDTSFVIPNNLPYEKRFYQIYGEHGLPAE